MCFASDSSVTAFEARGGDNFTQLTARVSVLGHRPVRASHDHPFPGAVLCGEWKTDQV